VLQLRASSEPLLPNLKSLTFTDTPEDIVPFIPLFLSTRTTSIDLGFEPDFPEVVAASVVTTIPTLCPNLQRIGLHSMPETPMITAAISEMFLAINRNILQQLDVHLPLTGETNELICKLSGLRKLRLTIDRPGSLPTLVLPNLVELNVDYGHDYDHDHGWLQGFRGATLGKLATVGFYCSSRSIGDFLEAFEGVALTTSIPATLSEFKFCTIHAWRPNYRSLLPFRQLKELVVTFSCSYGCSSTIDDDIMTEMARAMPKLELLRFGSLPCKTPAGVTVKGLAALAYYCPRLSDLCVHFQVVGLDPSEIPQVAPGDEPTSLREDCVLACLRVGYICVPEESTLMIALTLLRIFPRLDKIVYNNKGWGKVAHAIKVSEKLVDHSSKKHSFDVARNFFDDTPFRSYT